MLRAIKTTGNKIFTGETINECIENAKKEGVIPMASMSGWINEYGMFVTEKPSETIENKMANLEIDKLEKEFNPMIATQINKEPIEPEPDRFIKPKKGLKYLWNKIIKKK